jgi:hypothetical protein
MDTPHYLGIWILIPELSLYQTGTPPLSGRYTISENETEVHFEIEWVDINGDEHILTFGGSHDGARHPITAPGVTEVSFMGVDDHTLDSTAYDNGEVVMSARRVVSKDGTLLAVSQVIHTAEGKSSNFQVYRREVI